MTNKADYTKLINFSKGKYSYNDYLQIQTWFNEPNGNNEIKDQLFLQWNEFLNDEPDYSSSLQHIFETIQYEILLDEKKKTVNKYAWNLYRQVAAFILIPVLTFFLWYYFSVQKNRNEDYSQLAISNWVEINAPEGARVKFLLPDSTVGWLNSGSKLKYSPVFNKHRHVELSGEAYFEVKHLKRSEFTVSVANLKVKVLGTKFDISAYSNDQFTWVVLEEGKVEINGKAGAFHQLLSPDEKLTFEHSLRKLNVETVEVDDFIAWKDGYLVIDNEPLEQVAEKIERWYNAEIVIKDEKLKNYRFKATFKDEPLEEVLRLIAITTPIQYHIEKRTTDSYGAMKQKKVIIKMK